MKLSWTVGSQAHRVELEVSLLGFERVSVNGVRVLNKPRMSARSEHDLSVPGHAVKLVIRHKWRGSTGELFVDGVRLEPSSAVSTMGMEASIVGLLFGVLFISVFGVRMMIPFTVGLSFFLLQLFTKYGARKSQPLIPAVSLLGGHMGSRLVVVLFSVQSSSTVYTTLGEAGLFAVLSYFLLSRPSPASVIGTVLLEMLGIAVHLLVLSSTALGVTAPTRRSLVLSILLRVGVVILLFMGWRRIRKFEQRTGPAPLPPVDATLAAPLATAPAASGPTAAEATAMDEGWVRCGHCGLRQRTRAEATCKKCGGAYRGS